MSNIPVQCCRCKNKHLESERVSKRLKPAGGFSMSELLCPRCGAKAFYDLSPQVAWCWASGLIEIGDVMPADKADGSGAIKISAGPKAMLIGRLKTVARNGYTAGQLLVPGVPEAPTQRAKAVAMSSWLRWCAKANGTKRANGVVFAQEGAPL